MKRYVSGKRPDYAPMESSDEEDEDFQFVKKGKEAEPEMELEEEDVSDPRLRRLLNRVSEDVEERYRGCLFLLLLSSERFCFYFTVTRWNICFCPPDLHDTDRSLNQS